MCAVPGALISVLTLCTGGMAAWSADRCAQVMCAVGGIVFPGRNSVSVFGYDSRNFRIFVWTQEIQYLCLDTGDSVSLFGYDLQMCLLTCECQQIARVAPWGGVSSAG